MGNPKTTFEFDGDVKKVMDKLNELEAKINKTGKKGGGAGSDIASGFEGAVAGIAKVTAALGMAYAVMSTAGKALNTAAEYEQLQTRLENMYGSVEKGREAFQKFQEVAATTPYSLQGVVEAGASLKAFGVDAVKMIKPVSDLAAFMGVDVVEAAQAFGRAMAGGAGAADVLRDRGILQLVKSFKGIDDLTKLTLPQFRQALIDTIQNPTAGIVGATDKMSKTFKGAYSNMLDAVDQLANVMGKKMLPAATSVMQSISGMVGNLLPKESDLLRENSLEFKALAAMMTDANSSIDIRNKAIKEMQDKYGSYLGNIDLEKAGYEDIAKALNNANLAFEQRIKMQASKEVLTDQAQKAADAVKKLYDMEKEYYLMKEKGFEVARQRELYTPAAEMQNAMLAGIVIARENVQKLTDEYNTLKKQLTGMEISVDITAKKPPEKLSKEQIKAAKAKAKEEMKAYGDAALQELAVFETEVSEYNSGIAKTAAEEYIKAWKSAIGKGENFNDPMMAGIVSWLKKVNTERQKLDEKKFEAKREEIKLNKELGDTYVQLGEEYVKADDYIKESTERTVANLRTLEGQIENVVGGLVHAGIAGEDMGEALKKALQQVIEKAITMAIVFGIMQLIPGGSALTGGFGSFMKAGFGLGGAKASAQSTGGSFSQSASLQSAPTVSVQVIGALEGQKFMTNTIKPGEARLSGRSF